MPSRSLRLAIVEMFLIQPVKDKKSFQNNSPSGFKYLFFELRMIIDGKKMNKFRCYQLSQYEKGIYIVCFIFYRPVP